MCTCVRSIFKVAIILSPYYIYYNVVANIVFFIRTSKKSPLCFLY